MQQGVFSLSFLTTRRCEKGFDNFGLGCEAKRKGQPDVLTSGEVRGVFASHL